MTLLWDIYARFYDNIPKHFIPYKKLLNEIESILSSHKRGMLVDCGCGTGNFAVRMAKKGFRVTGLDLSNSMLSIARKKKDTQGLTNLCFFRLSLDKKNPFPDNSFDYLISVHTIYVLRNPSLALDEFYRILKKGGKAIIVNFQDSIKVNRIFSEARQKRGLVYALNVLFLLLPVGILNIIIGLLQRHGKYHYWKKPEFKRRLEKAGFLIESMHETYTNNWDLLAIARK